MYMRLKRLVRKNKLLFLPLFPVLAVCGVFNIMKKNFHRPKSKAAMGVSVIFAVAVLFGVCNYNALAQTLEDSWKILSSKIEMITSSDGSQSMQEISFYCVNGFGYKLFDDGTYDTDINYAGINNTDIYINDIYNIGSEQEYDPAAATVENGYYKLTVEALGYNETVYEGNDKSVCPVVIRNDGFETLTGITVNAPGMKIQGNGVGQQVYPPSNFNEFEENNTNAVENTTEEGGEENREITPSEEIIEETKPEESDREDISNDEQGNLIGDSEELIYNGYDYTQPATGDSLEANKEPSNKEIGNTGETELGENDKEDIKKEELESTDMQEPEELISNGFEHTQPVTGDGLETETDPFKEEIGDIDETTISETESDEFSEKDTEKAEPESAEVQETEESAGISYWYIRPVEEGDQAEIDEIKEEIREEIKEAIAEETREEIKETIEEEANDKTDESSNMPEEPNTENTGYLENTELSGNLENLENSENTELSEDLEDGIAKEEEIYIDQDSLSNFEQSSFSLFPGEEKVLYFSLSNDYGRGTYISQIDVTAAELYAPCSISLETRVYANSGEPWETMPDKTAPQIIFSEVAEEEKAPFKFAFHVTELETNDSGIAKVECYLNGVNVELIPDNQKVSERGYYNAVLLEDYSVILSKPGINHLLVRATDLDGNQTEQQIEIQVVKEELYVVTISDKLGITIDPDRVFGDTQIYNTDDFMIENKSESDVSVDIKQLVLIGNSGLVGGYAQNNCNITLSVIVDGIEISSITLQDGSSNDLDTFILKGTGGFEETHKAYLKITGDVQTGASDEWQSGNMGIEAQITILPVIDIPEEIPTTE